jgi:fatty acid amide hydrolase
MSTSYKLGENLATALANPRDTLAVVGGSILGIFSLTWIIKYIRRNMKNNEWTNQSNLIRRERDIKIETFIREHKDRLTEERKQYILSLPATKIVESIKSKKITAVETLFTYISRAATVGRDLSLIADVNFEASWRQAEEIDLRVNQNKISDDMTLLGLPVSIKDQIAVKGALQTGGITANGSYMVGYDSEIVATLRKRGAIPFVLSNVGQGLLSYESSNSLWGAAQNPWNRKKTVGGSSGGEAGLVASRCSPCGIASDIAGSIRLPSHFCGVYGFKPTLSRVSNIGVFNAASGFPQIQYSFGPICKTVDDIVLIMRALYGNFENDHYCYNLPFNEVQFNDYKKIKLGYFLDTDYNETAPSIKNVLIDVVDKMGRKGYDLISLKYELIDELVEIGYKLFYNSGGIENLGNILKGEEPAIYYDRIVTLRNTYNCSITMKVLFNQMIGENRFASIINQFYKLSRDEFISLSRRFYQLRSDFIKYLKSNRIEAIITPTFPITASNLNTGGDIFHLGQFLFMFNCLDMPAGNVPICLNNDTSYVTKYNDYFSKFISNSMKDSLGLPIGIQIATLPNQDELCLRIMKEVDGFYSFDVNFANKSVTTVETKIVKETTVIRN